MNKIKLVKDAFLRINEDKIVIIGIYWNEDLHLNVGDILVDKNQNKYTIKSIDFHSIPIKKVSIYVDNNIKPVGDFLYKLIS